ncbi:hypothetical protein FRZ06_13315 [Anoxybacterium hadale]|uniref:Uncharacterized protein n=1 Tax=Anoxybacterium hadale TaxID=3408580 RepID=A0ACD1AD71_9FIRM|nr:hypothetical protein FRZ06_13315 [Clostridiales bacterium]
MFYMIEIKENDMLYIILGIIMVFLAWMQAAYGKMQKYKNEARTLWIRIDSLLQTRSQYILQLLELADDYGLKAAELLSELFDLGGGYCKSDDREVTSAQAEAATPLIDKLLLLADDSVDMKEDSSYLELKNELKDVEEEIELQSEKYNQFIDLYNRHIETPSLRIQFSILGAPHLKGIHIR